LRKYNKFISFGLWLFLFLGSSLLLSLTLFWLNWFWSLLLSSSVEGEVRVAISNLPDEILGVEISQHFSCHRSVDLELIADNGD
jgi:hypothetical protein